MHAVKHISLSASMNFPPPSTGRITVWHLRSGKRYSHVSKPHYVGDKGRKGTWMLNNLTSKVLASTDASLPTKIGMGARVWDALNFINGNKRTLIFSKQGQSVVNPFSSAQQGNTLLLVQLNVWTSHTLLPQLPNLWLLILCAQPVKNKHNTQVGYVINLVVMGLRKVYMLHWKCISWE